MPRLILSGLRFGRWLVGKETRKGNHGEILWECLCDCGTVRFVKAGGLTGGTSTSCGCAHKEAVTIHGGTATPTFYTWQSMKQRCYYEKAKSYSYYGGRGITICERWRESFENFLADMGEKPKGHSLDRIDNDGPYSPENCRWASNHTQQRNKPSTCTLTYNGETLNVYEWAERVGSTAKRIRERMRAGWAAEDVLFRPVDASKRSKRKAQSHNTG